MNRGLSRRHRGGPVFSGIAALLAMIVTACIAGSRAADAQSAPVSAQPQQTLATYGDWTAHCQRVGDPERQVCEATQSLTVKGQVAPIAQIAISLADKPGTVTVLLPTSIVFDKPPQIGTDETHMLLLAYHRCVPAGCLADAHLEGIMQSEMRNTGKPGRLVFTDATERTIVLPVSFRGLAQALDDLAKQTGSK